MEVSADNPQSVIRHSWPRRHVVALSVVAALLLLYTLGGFLLVPHIARTQAISYVQHDLGRQLSIGTVKFNPFTFAVEIHDLQLAEADGAVIASLSMLHVEFNAVASLIHRAWTLADIRLQDPFVSVLINHDGSLNLEKLVPPSKQPAPAPSNSLPSVRIGLFSVHQGRVHFEDRSREEPFTATLSPIEFDLNDFRTQADFENRYQFSAATAAGERFDWSGQFDLRPLASYGEFSVSGLKATTIASYLEDALPCALNSGSLDLKGTYQFVAQGTAGPAISVTLPSVQLHQLAIAPKDAQASATPWVMLPELDVNDTKLVLNEHSVTVGEIALQKPALQVWREADGTLNLQQLAGPAKPAVAPAVVAPAAPTPASALTATPWNVTLAKLSIVEADIAAEDRSVKPALKLHLAPLNFTLQNASSAGTQPLSYELETALNESGHLHSAGTVTLTPLVAQVGIELKDLDLTALQPYVNAQAAMSITSGHVGSELKIAYADKPAKGQPQLQVTGSAQVMDLNTRDNVANADFISWSALEVTGLRYQMNPNALRIDRVHARGLYSRVIISPKGTINVKDVMQVPGASVAAATPAPTAPPVRAVPTKATARSQAPKAAVATAPAMPIQIKRIDIEDSTANFSDHSIEPNFSAGIVKLHGSIVGLSSAPSARAKITLDGQVDQFSPVQIRGEVNPFAATAYTDLSLSFHNMELTTFNPYSGKYAGYSIDQGKLSTDLHYHIDNRKLDATHHIVLDQLEFGAATESKQAVPLPIKLAVAILKDRNGVITLDLPEITGTLDDPTFKVGPLIWTFVVDLLKKIVTAPFAALGNLFGGGEEMSFIEFPAGAATIVDSEQQKLTKLSKALVERPKLRLDIPLHATSAADDDALTRAALDEAVTSSNAGKGSKHAAKGAADAPMDLGARLKALAALYKQKFNQEPEYPVPSDGKAPNPKDPATLTAHIGALEQQLLPQFKPTLDQRNDLGKARATAAQGALLSNTELQPERVFLTERESSGGEDGKVKMELKLE